MNDTINKKDKKHQQINEEKVSINSTTNSNTNALGNTRKHTRSKFVHFKTALVFFTIALLLMLLAAHFASNYELGNASITAIFSLLIFAVSQGIIKIENIEQKIS